MAVENQPQAKESVTKAFGKLEKNNTSVFEWDDLWLKTVDHEDIKQSVNWIKNQKFNIKWVDTPLIKIIAGLDATTWTAKYKGEAIKWWSDLGAAIQTYLIATRNFTWNIDGKIWPVSIQAIDKARPAAQRELNPGNNSGNNSPEVVSYNWEWVTQRQLDDHAFNADFNSIENGLYGKYVTKGVLKQAWFLNHTVAESERNAGKFDLTYTRDNWEKRTVTINLKKTNNKINTRTLAQDIKAAVDKSENSIEAEAQRKSIQEWIDKYNEKSIKDALMKSYLTAANKDFKYGWLSKGLVKIIDKKTESYWHVNKNELLDSNKRFSSWKFAWELVKHYKDSAIAREKSKLAKVKRDSQGKNITDKISDYNSIINEINGFWDKYKDDFAAEKNEAVKRKWYYETVKKISNARSIIEDPKSTLQDKEKALSGVVIVKNGVSNDIAIKVIDYSNNWRAKYAAVNAKDSYNTEISSLVRKVYTHWYKEINK